MAKKESQWEVVFDLNHNDIMFDLSMSGMCKFLNIKNKVGGTITKNDIFYPNKIYTNSVSYNWYYETMLCVFEEIAKLNCLDPKMVIVNWEDGAYSMFVVSEWSDTRYKILSEDEMIIKDIIE